MEEYEKVLGNITPSYRKNMNSRALIRCHTWFRVHSSRRSGLECQEDSTTAWSVFAL